MLTSGFFNAVNHDRLYNAEQMSQLFDGLITDGIFMTIGKQMMITADADMTVIMETGRAWFDHTWTLNSTRMPIDIEKSSDIYDRIDAIVLEVNRDVSVRENSIKVIKGENVSVDPVRPALIRTTYVKQYPLAYISIPRRTKTITQSLITNMVGTSETPFVTGIVEGINIDSLVAQWQDEWEHMKAANQEDFEEWFTAIQGQLAGDIATQLQQQINTQAEVISSIQQQVNAHADALVQQASQLQTATNNLASLQSALETFQTATNNSLSSLSTAVSGKQDKITGGATSILTSNLTANRALISDGSGKVAVSPVTSTELGYLDGVTSNVQTQLNGRLKSGTNLGQQSTGILEIYSTAQAYIDFHMYGRTTDYDGRIITDNTGLTLAANDGVVSLSGSTGTKIQGLSVNSVCTDAGSSGQWRYWKWTDRTTGAGLAICICDSVCPGNFANTAWGSLYISAAYSFPAFPFAFVVQAPICLPSLIGADSGYTTQSLFIMSEGSATLTKPPRYWFVRASAATIGHPTMRLAAIGRWK